MTDAKPFTKEEISAASARLAAELTALVDDDSRLPRLMEAAALEAGAREDSQAVQFFSLIALGFRLGIYLEQARAAKEKP